MRGQMKIMQMTFMIIAVLFFFILVGLFLLGIAFKDVARDAADLEREQAISSLGVIADMNELNFDGLPMAIDKDKLKVMGGDFGEEYGDFWPVTSIRIYEVYPIFEREIKCPATDCNYYEIYNDPYKETGLMYSSFVSICERVKEFGSVYDKCEIGKLLVGTQNSRGVS